VEAVEATGIRNELRPLRLEEVALSQRSGRCFAGNILVLGDDWTRPRRKAVVDANRYRADLEI